MNLAYFITGTDTGIGKTYASCALLHAFRKKGLKSIGMKPIAAGCNHKGINEDVLALKDASNIQASAALINPYCFTEPIAPHLAAHEQNIIIDGQRISQAVNTLRQQADCVIVEGVGGFMVPLGPEWTTADLATELKLPIILIVGLRLGCLNHALLTQAALQQRQLPFVGWIANTIDPSLPRQNENIHTLQHRLKAPLLGCLPYRTYSPENIHEAAQYLSLPLIQPGD